MIGSATVWYRQRRRMTLHQLHQQLLALLERLDPHQDLLDVEAGGQASYPHAALHEGVDVDLARPAHGPKYAEEELRVLHIEAQQLELPSHLPVTQREAELL